MSVHYKFRSVKNYDTIPFEGSVISVGDLKQAIIEQKKLGKANDFDLKFSNAQTKEDYLSDNIMIPKNTSIIVRRVPITQRIHPMAPVNTGTAEDGKPVGAYRYPTAPRMPEMRIPPPTYICHRCYQPGHYINYCPTNGDPSFDKVKKSTGIPKIFLKPVEGGQTMDKTNGALMTPDGGLAVLQHNSASFDRLAQSLDKKKSASSIPSELECPICRQMLKEAVITSCCGVNFCDHCIRRALFDDVNSCCPNCKKSGCSAKNLTPNMKIRTMVDKITGSNTATDPNRQSVGPSRASDSRHSGNNNKQAPYQRPNHKNRY